MGAERILASTFLMLVLGGGCLGLGYAIHYEHCARWSEVPPCGQSWVCVDGTTSGRCDRYVDACHAPVYCAEMGHTPGAEPPRPSPVPFPAPDGGCSETLCPRRPPNPFLPAPTP